MTDITKKRQPEPDDIDLFRLLERSILFFKKYKWIFGVALILGLASGTFTYSRLPKVYKSRMVIQSFSLSNPNTIQIIDNWNKLLKSGDHKTLVTIFNCPEKTVRGTKQIKAAEVQKMFAQGNPNGIYIDVYVSVNEILDELQQGIIYGLENTEYVSQYLAVRRNNLQQLIGEVSQEISKLDSMRQKIQSLVDHRQGNATSLIIDISGINKQLIDMNEKLLFLKQDLKFASAAQVLQGFNKFSKPAGPNRFVTLAVSIISFLVLAYIITLFISVNRTLKSRKALQKNTNGAK
jgi:hypothetical protein